MTKILAHCNVCGGDRNHDELHVEKTRWSDADDCVNGGNIYRTIKCGGCDSIKLMHVAWNSEQDDSEIDYFPPAVFRKHPDWFDLLSLELDDKDMFVEVLLNEIYVALHNNLLNLAAMGVRSLLEKVMISKTGDQGGFDKNITEFERLGYVSKIERKRLEAILDAGHAAIHRDYKPKRADVITLVDIAEHIIETVFIHEKPIAELSKRVPIRPPRPKNK